MGLFICSFPAVCVHQYSDKTYSLSLFLASSSHLPITVLYHRGMGRSDEINSVDFLSSWVSLFYVLYLWVCVLSMFVHLFISSVQAYPSITPVIQYPNTPSSYEQHNPLRPSHLITSCTGRSWKPTRTSVGWVVSTHCGLMPFIFSIQSGDGMRSASAYTVPRCVLRRSLTAQSGMRRGGAMIHRR